MFMRLGAYDSFLVHLVILLWIDCYIKSKYCAVISLMISELYQQIHFPNIQIIIHHLFLI